MVDLVHNVTEMIRLFTEIGTNGPAPAILLLMGALLVGFSLLFFGFLTVGGLLSPLIPDMSGRGPQQRG